jgi:hypothetical protein
MGRMKDVYMQIREEYGDQLPEDFSLAEYMLKKELEYEEIREIEQRLIESQKTSPDDAKDTSGSESSEKV